MIAAPLAARRSNDASSEARGFSPSRSVRSPLPGAKGSASRTFRRARRIIGLRAVDQSELLPERHVGSPPEARPGRHVVGVQCRHAFGRRLRESTAARLPARRTSGGSRGSHRRANGSRTVRDPRRPPPPVTRSPRSRGARTTPGPDTGRRRRPWPWRRAGPSRGDAARSRGRSARSRRSGTTSEHSSWYR